MGTCPTRSHSHVTAPESKDIQESIIVALHNYPSIGQTELTMRVGDRLTVTSNDGDFMMVKSLTTECESYIPTNYTAEVTHRWLYTGISRLKAEELLTLPENINGSFLIRESETNKDLTRNLAWWCHLPVSVEKFNAILWNITSKGITSPWRQADCYSLSVLRRGSNADMDSVKHYRISHLPNGWVFISPGLTFPSLMCLIDHYTENADGLCCRLTKPCYICGLDKTRPMVIRRPTINWKDISRSVIFKQKATVSNNSLVSEGLREAISSYLQMTEDNDLNWDM